MKASRQLQLEQLSRNVRMRTESPLRLTQRHPRFQTHVLSLYIVVYLDQRLVNYLDPPALPLTSDH